MMKKYVVLTLCLLLLVLAAVPAFAAENDTKITVTASKTVVQRGDTVDLTFSISGTTPLTSIALIPAFDAECFEFVSATPSSGISNFMAPTYSWGQPIGLYSMLSEPPAAGTPTGVMQTITLRVKETAPIKSYNITHDGISCANSDIDAKNMPVAFEGVTISVNCDHSYPETWTKKDDNQHQRICSKCNTPVAEDHIWPDEGVVNPIPSCTDGGKETFKCADCEATKVEDLDPQGHAWDNACDTTCNRNCGFTRDIVHKYASAYSSDGTNHWKECEICHNKKNVEAHTPGAAATELAAQTCTKCNRELQPALEHQHVFSTVWEYDSESHYHRCLNETVKCYAKKDEGLHVFDNECDIDCNTCGYVRVAPHKYDPSWRGNEEGHWRVCTVCQQNSDVIAHIPGPEATLETPQVCEDCHYVLVVSLNHVHTFGETWYHDDNQHWQTCSECNKSDTPADHTWDEGVTVEGADGESKEYTCSICNAKKTEQISGPTDPTQTPTESTGAANPGGEPTDSGRFPWQIAGIAAVLLLIAGIVLLVVEAVRSRKTNMHGKFSK